MLYEPIFSINSGVYCEACLARVDAEARAANLRENLTRQWLKLCPPRYQDTQLELLPYVDKSQKALEWKPGAGVGLNLWGNPDTGKTRTMLLVLRACIYRGKSVRLFEAGQFAEACERYAYRNGALANQLVRVDILAFDDMDKLSLTKHQEMTFFAILDRRMTRHRPTLFTHNSTATQLEYKFRCGEALTRRLRQFCVPIYYPPRVMVEQRLL